MTPEELLKPRYKVIADYPDNKHPIGAILQLEFRPYNGNVFGIEVKGTGGIWDEAYFVKYPHLFKKLLWWEDRKPEDMPEYLKLRSGQVVKYNTEEHLKITILDNYHALPATKDEYDIYINQKNQ